MKRITYLVLCIFTCFTLLTACGDDDKEPANDTPVSSDAEVSQQTDTDKDEDIDNNHEVTTEADNSMSEVPVVDAVPSNDEDETDEDDEEDDGIEVEEESSLTDAQENVAQNPTKEFRASGTFNGFIDSSSVEITMSDGSYQTFFVYDETAYNRLMKLSENETPPTISFVYKAKEGQINPEIISVN